MTEKKTNPDFHSNESLTLYLVSVWNPLKAIVLIVREFVVVEQGDV